MRRLPSNSGHHFDVTLRRPAYEEQLLSRIRDYRSEVSDLFSEISQLRGQLRETEQRLSFEFAANSELCDLLRANHISFRPALDRARLRR